MNDAHESTTGGGIGGPIIGGGHNLRSITDKITSIVLARGLARGWIVGFTIGFSLLMLFLVSTIYLFVQGVGLWGVQVPVAWGCALINFVWWLCIGLGGTLF